jgi:hypothetical protein
LAAFAKVVPDLTIVLNHLGGLTRIGPYANRDNEVLPAWRGGIAEVAKCPNVNIKLGGIGMPRLGFDWHTRARPIGSEELATSMAPIMSYCIEQFGPNRCMFESNFPVDRVVVFAPRIVQRVQALFTEISGGGARGVVSRHRGARLPHQRTLTRCCEQANATATGAAVETTVGREPRTGRARPVRRRPHPD